MNQSIPDIDLGKNIQSIRKNNNMTIKQLSELIGISASMLSQIERGLANPSIATLKSISDVLHEPLYNFFLPSADENTNLITRAGERSKYSFSPIKGDSDGLPKRPQGYECERLSTHHTPNLTMLRVTLPPHTASHISMRQHADTEIGYVEYGTVTVQVDNRIETLGCHDSITILPNVPHRWINETNDTVRLLLSMTVI